jgi:hypothetical protein
VEPLKLRVLSQFGSVSSLNSPEEIEVIFPFETDTLTKRMSYGHVKVLNDQRGEIEVSLSSFDIQGMSVGDNQNFMVKIISNGKTKSVLFERSLHIKTELVDGENRKVLFKK